MGESSVKIISFGLAKIGDEFGLVIVYNSRDKTIYPYTEEGLNNFLEVLVNQKIIHIDAANVIKKLFNNGQTIAYALYTEIRDIYQDRYPEFAKLAKKEKKLQGKNLKKLEYRKKLEQIQNHMNDFFIRDGFEF